ncbi:choline transporter-like protein 2 isoform X2 [Brachyhypopomus gauderio]|uniref:choline transporter-like protein 2 isoform X2 n=1 Tax=Brachyhypopomus gauderio TaxID=698409 RepID=UPI0040410DCD
MDLEEKKPEPKYGDTQKFDPNFKGPIHNRGCTDILCCIIFFLALLGYFAVGILAWTQGDPRKVIYPTDSMGKFCGQAGTPLEKKPFLFYFNIMKCASPLVLLEFQCPTTQICVEKCPNRFLTLTKAKLSTEATLLQYYSQYCKEGADLSQSVPEILMNRMCPALIIPSKPFTQRCLPALETKGGVVVIGNETIFVDGDVNINATDLLEASKKSNVVVEARQVAMRIFEDYTVSWPWIILGLVIAMLVSLVFIILLRLLAGIMVGVMITMVIAVIGYGIAHCYMQYASLRGQPGANITIKDLGLQTDFSVYLQIQQTWLAFMIILSIVEVVVIIILIFLRKRIMISIALLKEASRAIGHMMSSLFYPLLTFALLCLVIAYWAVTAVFLSTSSEPVYKVFNTSECEYSTDTCDPKTFNTSNVSAQCPDAECLFAFYGGETYYHKYLIFLQFYNLFLFFWCANFVTALGQVTLAGAFASYYWAFNKPDDIPARPICSSLGRALRYHTGSLAFGSLILSIVQVIRVILEYLEYHLKGAENRFAKFLLRCMGCCFWCLEKCIKFLNRNAYIMIAIYGKNFCTSAHEAFFLLMRNIVRVLVLDSVTDFLLFLGKLLIVGILGICSFFFFTRGIKPMEDAAPSLNYYWVPILTVVLGSYLIAHGFFSVYAMCVDTLFLCFCEDLERNNGSSDRPYLMSPQLHDILTMSKSTDDVDHTSTPPAGIREDVPLQENGEVQLRQQDVLKQDNEEETPLTQEAQQEEPEAPSSQEVVVLEVVDEEEEKADDEEVPPPPHETPQDTAHQNGPHSIDIKETEDPEQQEELQVQVEVQQGAAEPEPPKPQENGPQESDTPFTPEP